VIDKQLIRELQADLPVEPRPFKAGLIEKIRELQQTGVIRKFGAILKHQKAGFAANAMVVFNVPDESVGVIGEKIAGFKEVSHCYERPRFPGFNYNLYAMTHGKTSEELESSVRRIADAVGINDYQMLWSKKEYKKASPKYF